LIFSSAKAAFLAASLGLASCVPMDLPNQPYNLPTRVGPGKANLPTGTAVSLFRQVCGATAPSFAAAAQQMRASGQFSEAPIDVFYHRSLNAQFRIYDNPGNWRCTMVFRSDSGAGALASSFAALRIPGVGVFFQTTSGGTYSAIARANGL
tara:strand:- start:596 stop:1048 length:453 start_codon:yes stop_codon:yes gene_type:complete